MAREEYRVDLTADNEITDEAERAARALDDIPDKVETTIGVDTGNAERDIDGLMSKVDRLAGTDAAKLLLTSNATDVTQDIAKLILELDELDASDPEVQIKVDQIRQLEGDLETISAKAKEITGTPIALDTTSARQGFDDMVTGAGQANSAMANMAGNAAQDLGEIGGVAGSAGVAVGQLAEYFTDSAFAAREAGQGIGQIFGTFAKAAGPIAAAGIALAVIQKEMAAIQKVRAFRTEDAEAWADVIRTATDDVQALADHLQEIGKVEMVSGGLFGTDWKAEVRDVTQQIDQAGLSYEEFINLVNQERLQPGAIDAWAASMEGQLGDSYYFVERAADAARQKVDQFATAKEEEQRQIRLSMLSTEGATRATEEYLRANDTVNQMPATWEAVANAVGRVNDGLPVTERQTASINKIMAETGMTYDEVLSQGAELWEENRAAAESAAQAAAEYAAVIGSADWGAATLEGAAAGAERFAEAQFGLVNIASEAEAAYDSLNAAIEQNGFTFDLNTEAGRANAEQIQALYQSQIPAMAAAFDAADGSISAFRSGMDDLRANVMQQLREETSLTEGQIAAVVDQMGLVPANVSSQFEMMGTEEASSKLALLSGVISSLPEDVQRQVTLAVIAGDPQLALDTIEASVAGTPLPPATVPIEGDAGPFQATAEDVQDANYEATVDLRADRSPADRTTDSFTGQRRQTAPITARVDLAGAAEALLNFVSRPRTTLVYVGTSGVPQADGTLNAVARDRASIVHVGTSGVAAANNALNNVARDRTATIRANVVPTSVLVRVNGGG